MSRYPVLPSPELASLFTRLGVGASTERVQAVTLCIVASITNLRQIEQAHGTDFANTVRLVVGDRARILCDFSLGSATMSGEHILFVFATSSAPAAEGRFHAPITAILLDRILSALGDLAVECGFVLAFPAISAKVVSFSDAPFDIESVGETRMLHGQPGGVWREQFIADTQIAESIFSAFFEGRLVFEFEPVYHADGSGVIDYREALLCEVPIGKAEGARIGGHIPALERLGLARRLDRWVVGTIIGSLRADPDIRLGCNISGQSATLDAWWSLLLLTLKEEPDVARRLTVEITETAPLTELSEAREFVRALRSLGCRVALDDIGAGYSSLKNILILDVDIAKIDGSFVRHARVDGNRVARLRHTVALAKSCASGVVVEGIETEADARTARDCGATYLQGYLYSQHPGSC